MSPSALPRILFIAVAVLLAFAAHANATTYPTGFEEETLARGLTQPTAVAWTPDGRMLVLEKPGRLKVVAPGSTEASLIWDFSERVATHGDRGATGLAVDADFATNRYVYVLHTYALNPLNRYDTNPASAQLVRVQLSPSNQVTNATVLLGTAISGPCPPPSNTVDCFPGDSDSHSVGTVRAAADGTLYLGSGDGSSYNFAEERALRTYNEQSLSGKVLHVDRQGRGVPGHPFCPDDDDLSHVCTKVFAKGFRNPFRFTLRPEGGLTVGDVGWTTTEEVDLLPSTGGSSYGWPCYEGNARTNSYNGFASCQAEYGKPAGTHLGPVVQWPHDSGGGAALGGPTYPGGRYPAAYTGTTFYGDYVQGWIRRLDPDGTTKPFAADWGAGVDLVLDPKGDLTFVDLGDFGDGSGTVVAVRYPGGNRAPVASPAADRTNGPAPLTVSFDGTASSDPDGDPLSFRWQFGDGASSAASGPSHTYDRPGTYTATLTVTDPQGRSNSRSLIITAGNRAPLALIWGPANGSGYRDGQPVQLTGTVTDDQDGQLPPSALTWRVVLLHGTHRHIEGDLTGETPTFTPRTDHDADSHYEITLSATDSGGLNASRTIELFPETIALELASVPAGATLSWAGASQATPWSRVAAVGFSTVVDAPSSFVSAGRTYTFDRWSDGGARSHPVVVPATPLTLTATYRTEDDPTPSPSPTAIPAPPQATPVPPLRRGPVASLDFNERSGATTADGARPGVTVRLRGGARRVDGRRGRAIAFDGRNDRVVVPMGARVDLSDGITLSAWVRRVRASGPQAVLLREAGRDRALGLYAARGSRRTPVGFAGARAVRSSDRLRLGAWQHLVLTSDGEVERLYVDGDLRGEERVGAGALDGAGPLRIGGSPDLAEWFRGAVDQVRVYDRPLTAGQVDAAANGSG